MAGIGFELKKLFVGRNVIGKIRAYAYAGIACSGTMILAMVLLIGIQLLAKSSGAAAHAREALIAMVVYALLCSMMLASTLQTFLTRYVSDMLYRNRPERVIPSLLGASALLMVPGGAAYAFLLSKAPEIPLIDRAIDWLMFMELIPVWLQMAYITATKDYRRIILVFAAGVATALGLGAALIAAGLNAQTALIAAMTIGYGAMLVGNTGALLRHFPQGAGSALAFIEWFGIVPELIAIGFLVMAGTFVHIVMMWFGPLGKVMTGPFRQASLHDTAAFYAFLITLPANVHFIVSVEVNFYRKYRRYFDAILGGGTLKQIIAAREGMTASLKQEVSMLAKLQTTAMLAYAVFMRYYLQTIGFTTDMIAMFQVMTIGYSAYAIGNCLMLIQLYFNDLKGAMMVAAAFFVVNVQVTALTLGGPPLFYGLGLVAAGIAMYIVSMTRLFLYVRRIDCHVFCGQPLLAPKGMGVWSKAASRLNARADSLADEKGLDAEVWP